MGDMTRNLSPSYEVQYSTNRRTGLIALFFVMLCFSAGMTVRGDEPGNSQVNGRRSELKRLLSDDFSADSRDSYYIEGRPSWKPGELKIPPRTALSRTMNGGAWARLDIALSAENPSSSEVAVWIHLSEAPDCHIRFQFGNGSEPVKIQAGHPVTKDHRKFFDVRREVSVEKLPQVLSVEYRHGLITVRSPEEHLLSMYTWSTSSTTGFALLAAEGQFVLSRLNYSATSASPQLNDVQRQRLEEAVDFHRKSFSNAREGNYVQALQDLKSALAIRTEVLGQLHLSRSVTLSTMASYYRLMGDLAQAERLNRSALTIQKATCGPRHPIYAGSLNARGHLYSEMADYGRAYPNFVEAAEVWGTSIGTANSTYRTIQSNIAGTHLNLGDFSHAEELFLQLLKIEKGLLGEQDPDPDYAQTLNSLALICGRTERSSEARQHYQEALKILRNSKRDRHPLYAQVLNNNARECWRSGDFEESVSLYRQALAIRTQALGERHPDIATTLYGLASDFRSMGNHDQAESFFREALHIQRRHLNRNGIVQSARQMSLHQASVRFYLDDRISSVLSKGTGVTDLLEDCWQWKGAVTLRQRAYRAVASKPELAPLYTRLQSAVRQLSALYSRAPSPPSESATEAEKQEYAKVRESWQTRFGDLLRLQENLELKIAAGSAEFRHIQEPLTVQKVQDSLPKGTALVDLLEFKHWAPHPDQSGQPTEERRFAAFVVQPNSDIVIVDLGSADAIGAWISELRREMTRSQLLNANSEEHEAPGQRLRNLIWVPIESHLKNVQTVVISPDTILGTLPFAALPGKKKDSWLIQDYRLATIPAASMLPQILGAETSTSSSNRLMIVSGVDYDAPLQTLPVGDPQETQIAEAGQPNLIGTLRSRDNTKYRALNGFREEYRIVHQLMKKRYPDAPVTTLTGRHATESETLRLGSSARVLHVITHGYFAAANLRNTRQSFDNGEPRVTSDGSPDQIIDIFQPALLSGLAMAGANNPPANPDDSNDGILRASEIEAASLQGVELAVLSACETGLGKVAGGEGLTGLQRAFHIAGARTVIASLWKVDDTATTQLMKLFYTNLWQKKMSKLDALRAAQLTMLSHYDSAAGKLRGLGGDRVEVDPGKPPSKDDGREPLHPHFWAAFQLSGDWR